VSVRIISFVLSGSLMLVPAAYSQTGPRDKRCCRPDPVGDRTVVGGSRRASQNSCERQGHTLAEEGRRDFRDAGWAKQCGAITTPGNDCLVCDDHHELNKNRMVQEATVCSERDCP
jgi:hypothetical protein